MGSRERKARLPAFGFGQERLVDADLAPFESQHRRGKEQPLGPEGDLIRGPQGVFASRLWVLLNSPLQK
jgi:hypothetical protein